MLKVALAFSVLLAPPRISVASSAALGVHPLKTYTAVAIKSPSRGQLLLKEIGSF
jgi:hypothetical protein